MTSSSAFSGQVPDTLDLVEHGKLAIRGILNSLNPNLYYEPYMMGFFGTNPPYLLHWAGTVSGVQPKFFEALPMLRLMTGSHDLSDLEDHMIAAVDENLAMDGLLYDRALPQRPWNAGIGYGIRGWNEDYANMAGNGRLLIGFIYNYLANGDEAWKQRGRRTAERMAELVIDKGDYAYYPQVGCGNDFSYPRISGWTHTQEPQTTTEGAEGAMLFYHLQPVRGFAHWYNLTGDERFLDLARKFVSFGMQPRWWGGFNDVEPLAGQQRGHFWGHWHAHTAAIRGVLDYGVVAGDYRAKQFARDAYEWGRMHGIHRLCVYPTGGEVTEGCTLGDMTALAVALTDAGMGDYWDDVEQYARNGLIEGQLYDQVEIERVSLAGRERPRESPWGVPGDPRFQGYGGVLPGQEITERALERLVGAYGTLQGARYLGSGAGGCCTANGAQGLYWAWEGIVRQSGTSAQVNMWLNRRSPWVDVWSWLPHEGKLVVQNKSMRQVTVRLPGWTSPAAVRCMVNGAAAEPEWQGNRAVFADLQGQETICLEAPVRTERTEYAVANLAHRRWRGADNYQCEFRGHTAISVGEEAADPSGRDLARYRLFRRDYMRAAEAPMKAMPAYVHPEKMVHW